MSVEVYYYSKGGNTKKLADAVAKAVGAAAKDVGTPLENKADILFLGSSLYAGGFDPAVADFIAKYGSQIGTLVCFGSSASGKSTFNKVKALAEEKGVKVYDEFYNCPGHFLFLHKNRPNQEDLDKAAAFAKKVYGVICGGPNS